MNWAGFYTLSLVHFVLMIRRVYYLSVVYMNKNPHAGRRREAFWPKSILRVKSGIIFNWFKWIGETGGMGTTTEWMESLVWGDRWNVLCYAVCVTYASTCHIIWRSTFSVPKNARVYMQLEWQRSISTAACIPKEKNNDFQLIRKHSSNILCKIINIMGSS